MKNISFFNYYTLGIIAAYMAVLSSCKDAGYTSLDTHAYIEEALDGNSSKVTIPATGETTTKLNIHVSDAVSKDSHYELIADQSVLDEYNQKNGTSYTILPKEQYKFPNDIVIKSGQYNADESTIVLNAFTQDMVNSGESYALPIRLVSTDGNYPVMGNTGKFIILAENIVKFSAPMFNGGADLFSQVFQNKPETYSQYTIETRFQVSDTNNRNRAVFYTEDGQGRMVLLRFEDPQSANGDTPAHSLVQIQLHAGYVNPTNYFKANEWQHLAVTYDGSSYRIYVNGVISGTLACSDPCTTFSSVKWFTDGDGDQRGWWSGCKILVSEARIWSVARTADQIQNSMTQVSPKSKGLEAYWRMNEGKGNEFQDATGKGHTLTTNKNITWIDNILSTDKSTPWE